MNESDRYQPLSPAAMAVAFAVLALLGAFSMGMPFMLGMGSMMGLGATGWPGFGLLGLLWGVALAALGGAIVAWVYNAVIGTRTTRDAATRQGPLPPTATHP
ncbi:hypothetical protein EPN52_07565 [bacterium]|nr:MAG: hypothetical protein EPN52_07565 [bacterium]